MDAIVLFFSMISCVSSFLSSIFDDRASTIDSFNDSFSWRLSCCCTEIVAKRSSDWLNDLLFSALSLRSEMRDMADTALSFLCIADWCFVLRTITSWVHSERSDRIAMVARDDASS